MSASSFSHLHQLSTDEPPSPTAIFDTHQRCLIFSYQFLLSHLILFTSSQSALQDVSCNNLFYFKSVLVLFDRNLAPNCIARSQGSCHRSGHLAPDRHTLRRLTEATGPSRSTTFYGRPRDLSYGSGGSLLHNLNECGSE